MQYLEIIKNEIGNFLREEFEGEGLVFSDLNFSVDFPDTLEHGDITTNICLVAAKILKKSPKEVFDLLESQILNNQNLDFIEKTNFVNPGFLNISLRGNVVKKEVEETLRNLIEGKGKGGDRHFVSKKYDGKRVLVEHTSINLFKPFGIGHMMTNFTGEFIYRITKFTGANAINMSYPSDISIGVAKALYIIKKDGGLAQEIFSQDSKKIVMYLGQSYVRGVTEFKKWEEDLQDESNLKNIREVKNIVNNLFGNIPGEDLDIYNICKKANIDYFKDFALGLGSKFEDFIYESEAGVEGKRIVLENMGIAGIFYKSEWAIVYTPDEIRKDISTSVFINSEGNPTYLAKDIGLLSLKFKKYNPDLSIYVVDNEQAAHFKSVFDAGGKINKTWAEKSVHVSHGRMTFKGKKMSSRLGGLPSGEEVINAVLEEVKEKGGGSEAGNNEENKKEENKKIDRFVNFSPQEKEKLQREIALSALRISILRSKPGVNIDFDPDKAVSFEGDSGPYLCYTFARCCSLLERGGTGLGTVPLLYKEGLGEVATSPNLSLQRRGVGHNIERKLFQFEKIVLEAAEEIAPQKLIKYLFELAGEFNSFYANNKIIDGGDLEKTKYNLYLTKMVSEVLKKGLYLIGVDAPEKM